MTVSEQKKRRRGELRDLLTSVGPEAIQRASMTIRASIRSFITGHHQIAAFAALPGEPEVLPQDLGASTEHQWCLPRVQGKELNFYRIGSAEDLTIGAFAIREPHPQRCPQVPVETIDLFLIPGLGFDPATGQRIGRGKGFYDRALANAHPDARLVGVCLECQLGPVPREAHDIPLHAIITEGGLYESH